MLILFQWILLSKPQRLSNCLCSISLSCMGFQRILLVIMNILLCNFWKEFFRLVGTTLMQNTTYHPQTNEHIEIMNKCLEGYLRNSLARPQASWPESLHLVQNSYNTTYHTANRMSPFKALYSYYPPLLNDLTIEGTQVTAVKDLLKERQQILKQLKKKLKLAQDRIKSQQDQHCSEQEFELEDWVF